MRVPTVLALLLASTATLADSGPYVGASIGSATVDDDFSGFNVDEDSEALRFVLGYRFTEQFSLEAGYHRFGTFEEDDSFRYRLDADGVFFGGQLGAPLSDTFRLIGRAGLFFYDDEYILEDILFDNDDDDGYLYYGAGAEVDVSDRLSLVGEWTRYDLQDTDSDVISIGFTYRF